MSKLQTPSLNTTELTFSSSTLLSASTLNMFPRIVQSGEHINKFHVKSEEQVTQQNFSVKFPKFQNSPNFSVKWKADVLTALGDCLLHFSPLQLLNVCSIITIFFFKTTAFSFVWLGNFVPESSCRFQKKYICR